jgi:putative transposase
MPRKARVDAPGALHHIICRGIERKKIFRDNTDRDNFVERLGNILLETSTQCYAWSLIPNHFHLLLKTGNTPITTVMRRLLTGYAVTFNHRYRRHGHLFQNRYKSILCQEEPYLLELVRYIHLNPLRSKLVSGFAALNRYRYSGHSRLMGQFASEWQATESVLRRFGKRLSTARNKYAEFVEGGISQGRRQELTGGGLLRSVGGWKELHALRGLNMKFHNDERILGDSDFVADVLKDAEESLERKHQYQVDGFGFAELLQLVAEMCKLDAREIMSSGKQPLRVEARSLLCYWAVKELGHSVTSVATMLGMTQPAISRAVQRGEVNVREQKYILNKLRKA